MILVKSTTNNPYFNIATEEYLLKNSDENILFVYRNSPSIIIGKHQIRNLEVNNYYVYTNNIPVIRRISGGGSVFHDEGNINYSIITSSKKTWVDFEKFTTPLITNLKSLGLQPELRSKSDIRLDGKKISGNASHIFKSRVMHHGSILFDTDLEQLKEVLKNKPSNYVSSTVKSRRSIVTNIASHLANKINTFEFEMQFLQDLRASGFWNNEIILSENAQNEINNLITEKYSTTEWNVQYNANYNFRNIFLYKDIFCEINLKIKKGFCETANIKHPLLKDNQTITQNVPHETMTFCRKLSPFFTKKEILNHFF